MKWKYAVGSNDKRFSRQRFRLIQPKLTYRTAKGVFDTAIVYESLCTVQCNSYTIGVNFGRWAYQHFVSFVMISISDKRKR